MWPVLVAGAVGFLAAHRGQPRTKCERKVVLGARTGRTYDVEEFPETGFLVVRATGGDNAYGVFQHAQQKHPSDPRFSWRGGKGASELLHGMCLDLGLIRETGTGDRGPGAGRNPDPESKTRNPEPAARDPKSNVVQHPAAQKTGS